MKRKSNKHNLTPFLSSLILGISINAHAAPQSYHATLAGHAILPARTFIQPPADAPDDLRISGKFIKGKRNDVLGSTEAKSGQRPTDLKLPFSGQPVQGHSGVKVMKDGTIWLLTDNGFGNKKNSTDAALFLRHYSINWKDGSISPLNTVFLSDPDKKVPFRIINEDTKARYLTGGDFDPESIQITKDRLWIGEEFGPYLIEVEHSGKVIAVHETLVNGKTIHSPDNPAISLAGAPDGNTAFQVKRSKGFEGMAISTDGSKLYPLLEGAIWNDGAKEYENKNGKQYLRILEFDTTARKYTGKSWQYPLEDNSHAIGDFNMIDGEYGLIIERDNLEGTAAYPCKDNSITHCFDKPAKFKRVYKIRLSPANSNSISEVEKLGYIDLMDIKDPQKIARKPLIDGKFTFPFFTIENVDIIDENHIIIGNDNNLPFSTSREPNKVDDNELILLNVGDFLKSH